MTPSYRHGARRARSLQPGCGTPCRTDPCPSSRGPVPPVPPSRCRRSSPGTLQPHFRVPPRRLRPVSFPQSARPRQSENENGEEARAGSGAGGSGPRPRGAALCPARSGASAAGAPELRGTRAQGNLTSGLALDSLAPFLLQ